MTMKTWTLLTTTTLALSFTTLPVRAEVPLCAAFETLARANAGTWFMADCLSNLHNFPPIPRGRYGKVSISLDTSSDIPHATATLTLRTVENQYGPEDLENHLLDPDHNPLLFCEDLYCSAAITPEGTNTAPVFIDSWTMGEQTWDLNFWSQAANISCSCVTDDLARL